MPGVRASTRVVCAVQRASVHLRQCAVGVARQTVSSGVAVLPHRLLVLLHPTGTVIHADVAVLEVPAFHAVVSTL